MRLVLSRNRYDLSPGSYILFFDTDNVLKLLYKGPDVVSLYWPDPWHVPLEPGRTTYNSSRNAVLDQSGIFSSSDQFQVTALDYGSGCKRRLTLDFDGNLRLYSLGSGGAWGVTWQAIVQSCRVHGACADLQGFNYSCPTTRANTRFLPLPRVDFYGYDLNYTSNKNLSWCKGWCLRSCDCKGILYRHGFCYTKALLLNGRRSSSPGAGTVYLKIPRELVEVSALALHRGGGFREQNVIGRGGTGVVYKGVLSDQRRTAIKRLEGVPQGQEEFLAEMWGFCAEGKHRLLVYEYADHGSLADNVSSESLDWDKRFEIALGTARGLAKNQRTNNLRGSNDLTLIIHISNSPMCKSKKDVLAAHPTPRPSSRTTQSVSSSSFTRTTTSSSSISSISLSSLRGSLPDRPILYRPSEIASATSNFHPSRRLPSASSGWRCSLRGRDAAVFLRPFRRGPPDSARLHDRLASVSRGHHISLVRLLGAAASADGGNLYVVYEYVPSASLASCLRNPKNPDFTVLSTWTSRMQVAADLAHGLEYIHNHVAVSSSAGTPRPFVHNRIKSSAVIVTEPSFNAKICHFGTAILSGEVPDEDDDTAAAVTDPSTSKAKRPNNREMKIEGSRGYMAPEVSDSGAISQKSDIFALGVVLLELLSGEEPLKYKVDNAKDELRRVSLIETARRAMESTAEMERRKNVRRWIDRRLRDSFPVEVAERLARVALDCVHADPEERPDATRVTAVVSKMYLESMAWEESIGVPRDFTVSLAPR
ncbi:putative receptor protein kinase ZmPK1 [Acorus gramineus]|uniref:Receptor protein kinase ZmPK1 n=1 Tax=Acorus gramineus TaxID=55184 RepID=A0AAV9A9J7_ACOGR|nr:putative receptor protein kinase ZmPK1 [Acorus gramineus]